MVLVAELGATADSSALASKRCVRNDVPRCPPSTSTSTTTTTKPPTTTTTSTSTTTTTTTTPTAPVSKPSAVVGTLWTVMAPFAKPGTTDSPENLYVTRAETDARYTPYFGIDADGGVKFVTPANGVHSANSKYPRTELREMRDTNWTGAAWSSGTGTHTMEGDWSVTHTFVKRPQVVLAQIHDGSDDVMQAAVDGSQLVVFANDKATTVVLDPAYRLGTRFHLEVAVAANRIKVSYNGTLKADLAKSGSGWYFKAGSYIQTNVADWGEAPDATATVKIYSLSVNHS